MLEIIIFKMMVWHLATSFSIIFWGPKHFPFVYEAILLLFIKKNKGMFNNTKNLYKNIIKCLKIIKYYNSC